MNLTSTVNARSKCDPSDVALKAHFLGPQAENFEFLTTLIENTLRHWSQWRASHFPQDGCGISEADKSEATFGQARTGIETCLAQLASLYEKEIPTYSPHYIGHMVSETSIPAIVGHFLALLHNPNNVTRDSSAAGLVVERESIFMLAQMLNLEHPAEAKGHFTSGGTVANMEGLLRALKRQMFWLRSAPEAYTLRQAAHSGWLEGAHDVPTDSSLLAVHQYVQKRWQRAWNPRIFVPMSAHYSWEKAASFLGLGIDSLVYVPLDASGRTDPAQLRALMQAELDQNASILAVISLAGSTEMGSIDALDEIQNVLDSFQRTENLHIWHHVDAAYGGFFAACPRALDEWGASLEQGFRHAQSVTIDPHKLGYVPYAAGVILVRDGRDYAQFNPGAPYLDADCDWPGAQTLEGSRSATGATAFWMMARSMGLGPTGLGRVLARSLKMRKAFQDLLKTDGRFLVLPGCNSNLALFSLAPTTAVPTRSLRVMNQWVKEIMQLSQSGRIDYKFSITTFDLRDHAWLRDFLERSDVRVDQDTLSVLRMVFMNPFIDSRESRVQHTAEIYDVLTRLLEIGG